jgi:glycerate-2-kinase
MTKINTENFLIEAFAQALKASDPMVILPASLTNAFKKAPKGRCLILGAGKAAA